jgi:(p)ppGpp synthase/HD superfamily hydrolase
VIKISYLEKAICLAVEKHKGQTDKGGMPYILHPIYVMGKMETETEKIVAILHDVVEDTDTTFDDLRNIGFSEEILRTLECLTRGEEEDYFDYVGRIKTNPLAIKVKLADLEHNMDFRRIKDITDEDIIKRTRKYKQAWDELKSST